jgi:uncharacterized protein involved in outer membrane biogenesis
LGRGTVSLRTVARSVGLLAGVLLTALLLAAAVVRLPPIQRWAAAQVAARLPAGVSIERAALTLLPPGVRLARVTLAANGPTLKSVSCRLRMAALLAGRIEIGSIVVDGAAFTVERGTDGGVQVAGPLAPLLAAAATPDAAAPRPEGTVSLAALPAVTVTNGSLTFVDRGARGGPRTLQLSDLRLTLGAAAHDTVPLALNARLEPVGRLSVQGTVRQTAAAGAAPAHTIEATLTATHLDANLVLAYLAAATPGGGSARAEGTLDGSLTLSGELGSGLAGDAVLTLPSGSMVWDEVHLGAPLKLSAHLSASGAGVALSDGQLAIAQLAAARITASDIGVAFAFATPVLHLTAAHATAYEGTWTQSGTVTLTDPPSFDVNLRADGVACEALLTAVTGVRPQYGCERFSADAAVHGPWSGARTVARGAAGSGHVDMHGGTIPSSSIIGAIWQAIVPLVHAPEGGSLGGPPSRVDHLTQSFTLRSGRMHTNDLSLVTDDYRVSGGGSIGLDGTLDLNTEVAMTATGVTKLLTMASLPIPGEPGNLPPIPTRITGSVGDPIVRPEVEHLPVAAVQALFQGARGAGEALKDAAGAGVRSLEDGIDKLW